MILSIIWMRRWNYAIWNTQYEIDVVLRIKSDICLQRVASRYYKIIWRKSAGRVKFSCETTSFGVAVSQKVARLRRQVANSAKRMLRRQQPRISMTPILPQVESSSVKVKHGWFLNMLVGSFHTGCNEI